MTRINFTEEEISRCLSLYMKMAESDAHRMQGAKTHLSNLMSTDLKTFWPRDINTILDTLKSRGLIGEHHIPRVKIQHGEKCARIALQKDLLLRNTLLPPNQYAISDASVSVLALGDIHCSPRLSNDRLTWLGRLSKDRQPKHIIQIGDWASLDSLSAHEKPGTAGYAKKPSFKDEDLPNFIESLALFDKACKMKGYKPIKHVTLGNHEWRLERYENENPETGGMFTHMFYSQFEKYGWTYSPYGASHFIEGVEFTHAPFNIMGKPQAITELARVAVHDTVFGHTHVKQEIRVPKRGHDITLINLGCALPQGHIEAYAKHSLTGWSYGVYMLNIYNGRILDSEFISMRTLEKMYGNPPD